MNLPHTLHIAFAENYELVRKGIVEIINAIAGIEVTIAAEYGTALLAQIRAAKRKPDVAILYIHMKGMDGLETLIELKRRWPDIEVVTLTMEENERFIV